MFIESEEEEYLVREVGKRMAPSETPSQTVKNKRWKYIPVEIFLILSFQFASENRGPSSFFNKIAASHLAI